MLSISLKVSLSWNKKIPPEVLTSLNGIDEAARLADTIAAHMPLKLAEKQQVLEIINVNERLEIPDGADGI